MLPDDAKSFWGFLAVEILPIGYCTLLFSSSFLMSSIAVTTRARFRSCSIREHTTDSFVVISCWRRNVFWLLSIINITIGGFFSLRSKSIGYCIHLSLVLVTSAAETSLTRRS